MSCAASDKGYLAPVYADSRWAEQLPEHDTEYYFDPDKPLSGENGCAD